MENSFVNINLTINQCDDIIEILSSVIEQHSIYNDEANSYDCIYCGNRSLFALEENNPILHKNDCIVLKCKELSNIFKITSDNKDKSTWLGEH